VLCRDRWEDTRRCLEAVRLHTPAGLCEVLAYDNASPDGTAAGLRELARDWPALRTRANSRNVPFSEAVNQGMRDARGELFLWLNNDTVPGPGWLEGLLGALDSDPRIAGVGPTTDHMAPPAQIAGPCASRREPEAEDAVFLGGFCFLVRRTAVERVGNLDERFLWGWEDMDYCLRLVHAGFRLALARGVFVRHEGNRTIALMPAAERRRTDLWNRRLILEKWFHARSLRADILELFSRTGAPWDIYRPEVSVIVAGRAAPEHTERCLDSVRRCSAGAKYEALAADACLPGRESDVLRLIERFGPETRFFSCPGDASFARTVNRAMLQAQGDFFVILRNDALVAPGWLERLVQAARAHPAAGAVGTLTNSVTVPWQDRGAPAPASGPGPRPVPYLRAVCLLVARAAAEKVGPLDERFAWGLEDVDYCLRLRQAGFAVLLDEGVFVANAGNGRHGAAREEQLLREFRENSRLLFEKWAGHPLFLSEMSAAC